MKKLLGMIIVFGFILMLGAAGSADISDISFFTVLILEAAGMLTVLFGISALMHYNRYIRRTIRLRAGQRRQAQKLRQIAVSGKEIC